MLLEQLLPALAPELIVDLQLPDQQASSFHCGQNDVHIMVTVVNRTVKKPIRQLGVILIHVTVQ